MAEYNVKFNDIEPINYGCATHPHNIFLEIFAEMGVVGTSIFLFLISYIIKISIKNNNYNIKALILSYIFILFFPIQTTGSFFSTFNGIFYYICLSVVLYMNKYYKTLK